MRAIKRRMTKKEKSEMVAIVSAWSQLGRFVLASFFTCILVVPLYILNHYLTTNYPWWIVGASAVWLFIAFVFEKFSGGYQFRQHIREDIKAGEVLEEIYAIKESLRFTPIEDEGAVYIIEDLNGDVFILSGQDLDALEAKGFPRENLKVAKGINSGLEMKISVSGNKIVCHVASASYPYLKDTESSKFIEKSDVPFADWLRLANS